MSIVAPELAAKLADLTLEEWVALQKNLLALERDAEIAESFGTLSTGSIDDLLERGVSLPRLVVLDVKTGLFGRTVLVLGFSAGQPLPAHKFTTGDIAGILMVAGGGRPMTASTLKSMTGVQVRSLYDSCGVILEVSDTSISITLDEQPDVRGSDDVVLSIGEKIRLDKLADDVTFRRLSDALHQLESNSYNSAANVISLLFGSRNADGCYPTPRFSSLSADAMACIPRDRLNDSQVAAIHACLAADDIAMIHGPPGTGKTTTVVELLRAEVGRGRRVLACAPSNVAVDNIALRLSKQHKKLKIVRLGHPARLMPAIMEYSLDALVTAAEGTSIVADVRSELNSLGKSIRKERDKAARRALRGEERRLKAEIRAREERVVMEIIRQADVVLATATGAATKLLRKALTFAVGDAPTSFRAFDTVVIDEVAQGLESACLIPMLLGRKLVVAGDHLQLPPTIISNEAAAQGLGFTLADRIVQRFGKLSGGTGVVHMLNTQYRMHETIMGWSNGVLYEGRLLADSSVRYHRLSELPLVKMSPEGDSELGQSEISNLIGAEPAVPTETSVSDLATSHKKSAVQLLRRALESESGDISVPNEYLDAPMLLIDTAGCDLWESTDVTSESKANIGEAAVAVKHLLLLLKCGVRPEDVAIVTPYNAQVALIKAVLGSNLSKVEVRSVDGFQGQEKEVIIITMVRSNHRRDVGFLSDSRRMNVAVTRARRHLAVVADSDTVSTDAFLNTLIEYMSGQGTVASAAEYQQESVLTAASAPTPHEGRMSRVEDDKRLEIAFRELLASFKAAAELQSRSELQSSRVMDIQHPKSTVPGGKAAFSNLSSTLTFPSTLSNNDRRLVHLAAEALHMDHVSHDISSGRIIIVSYTPPTSRAASSTLADVVGSQSVTADGTTHAVEAVAQPPVSALQAEGSADGTAAVHLSLPLARATPAVEEEHPSGQMAEASLAAGGAGRAVKKGSEPPPVDSSAAANEPVHNNALLKRLHDMRLEREGKNRGTPATNPVADVGVSILAGAAPKAAKAEKAARKSETAKPQKPKAVKASAPGKTAAMSEEDEWALIEAAASNHGKCGAESCSKSTVTLGTICNLCKMKYCYKHALPEAHGCDDAVRAAARAAWLSSAGGRAPPKLNAADRATAARELHKRIESAEAARTGETTRKGKKK